MTAGKSSAPAIEDLKTGVVRRGFEGIRFEPSPKRVRVLFGGRFVADSRRAHLLFEPERLPVYYFPLDDVAGEALERSNRVEDSNGRTKRFHNVTSGARRADDAAWTLRVDGGPDDLDRYVAFRWDAMDGWFEEDDEVFVHARDPYHRVDIVRSSRHVRVTHAGRVIAESRRPVILFETGLPPRYYLPKADLALEMLEPSQTRTQCPYKGEADHWSARIDGTLHEDVAWSYRLTTPEATKIENLVSFYQERVDEFEVDGEVAESVTTPWSRTRSRQR